MTKGPSLFQDRAEASVTLAETTGEPARDALAQAFLEQTGYRLIVNLPAATPARTNEAALDGVLIPVARIRLTAHQQSLTPDPEKARKALERAQRAGQISPPVQLRRVGDGYVMVDGLYRLRAAQTLGWEKVLAIVE